eukprot:3659828-Amphidinium_carterae.1
MKVTALGIPVACESVLHAVRRWQGRNGRHLAKAWTQLDLTNAFNEADRSAVQSAVRRDITGNRHSGRDVATPPNGTPTFESPWKAQKVEWALPFYCH